MLYLYLGSPRPQRRFAASPSAVLRRRSSGRASSSTAWSTAPCRGPRSTTSSSSAATWSGSTRSAGSSTSRCTGSATAAPVASPPMRVVHWSSLLRSCSAYEAYLREHHDRIDPEGVVRYLVLDADFPRAIRFCVARCLRVAPRRSPAATTTATAPRPSACSAGSTASCATSTSTRSSPGASAAFLDGIQDACNRSATRSTRRTSSPDPTRADRPVRRRRTEGSPCCSASSHETQAHATPTPVAETVFEVRMAPPSDEDQTTLGYRLRTTPQAPVTSYRDGFGNRVDLFNIATPYQRAGRPGDQLSSGPTAAPASDRLAEVRLARPTARSPIEALEFLQPSPLVDRCAGARRLRRRAAPAAGARWSTSLERLMAARPRAARSTRRR